MLYVPSLGHSLMSWNRLKHKLRLSGHGKYMTVTTLDNSPIFDIEIRGSLPYVVLNTTLIAQASTHTQTQSTSNQAPSESMLAKAHFWHASLGHPSRITPAAYSDGHILSQLPSFQCEPCITSKSVHSVPHSLADRSNQVRVMGD